MSFFFSDFDSGVSGNFGSSSDSAGQVDKTVIKKFALNTYNSFFTTLDFINEIFVILSTIDVNDDTVTIYYETEFINAFPLTRITEINNLIKNAKDSFTELVSSNSSSIQSEDNVYIQNISNHALIVYRQLDFLILTVSKITTLLNIRETNSSLLYYETLVKDLDKLKDYLSDLMGANKIVTEVESAFHHPMILKEPYNTYMEVYGFPQGAAFESNKLQIIQEYLDSGYSTSEIVDLINI
ncbi:hypothetical protein CL656_04705 [bacterium]|nr:hypothetical protein [bacterium]